MGDYFGESALIEDRGKRQASVVAITEVKVLSLEKHDFMFVFGDGFGGQGPVIEKMKKLIAARKQKAIHVLFKNSIFSQLTPSQKTQLELIMIEEGIGKGEFIWKAGDEAEFVILVRQGAVAFVDCALEEVDEITVGGYVGEVKQMYDNEKLKTNLQAKKNGSVFKIKKNEFIDFLKRNPGLYMLFKDIVYVE